MQSDVCSGSVHRNNRCKQIAAEWRPVPNIRIAENRVRTDCWITDTEYLNRLADVRTGKDIRAGRIHDHRIAHCVDVELDGITSRAVVGDVQRSLGRGGQTNQGKNKNG